MSEPQKAFQVRNIGGKDYTCKKLPYTQARPLQLAVGELLLPVVGSLAGKGNVDVGEAFKAALPNIDSAKAFDMILRLSKTCMVDGRAVNPDVDFTADGAIDIELAAFALEVHLGNFIPALQSAASNIGSNMKAHLTSS